MDLEYVSVLSLNTFKYPRFSVVSVFQVSMKLQDSEEFGDLNRLTPQMIRNLRGK